MPNLIYKFYANHTVALTKFAFLHVIGITIIDR